MKYPQAYLVIHKDFVMPPLQTLKAWAQPCQDWYAKAMSEEDKAIENNISSIIDIHTFSTMRWSEQNQVIVLECKEIPEFLLLKIGTSLLEVYWLEDEKSIGKISEINDAFQRYENFKEYYEDALNEFEILYEFISKMNSEDEILEIPSDFPDNYQDITFFSQLDDSYFDAADVLKRMTKTLTHAGKLARSDL